MVLAGSSGGDEVGPRTAQTDVGEGLNTQTPTGWTTQVAAHKSDDGGALGQSGQGCRLLAGCMRPFLHCVVALGPLESVLTAASPDRDSACTRNLKEGISRSCTWALKGLPTWVPVGKVPRRHTTNRILPNPGKVHAAGITRRTRR